MTLARLDEVLADAAAGGRGVGAFNVIQLEHAEALVDAAERDGTAGRAADQRERCALPRLAGADRAGHAHHRGAGAACRASCTSTTPSASRWCDEAVALGFTSVMFDGSRLGDEANRTTTRAVVQRCHAAGVNVEAELGEIGGKDGVHAPGVRTDPATQRRIRRGLRGRRAWQSPSGPRTR